MSPPIKNNNENELTDSSTVDPVKVETDDTERKRPAATSKKWLAIVYACLVLAFALGFWLTDMRSEGVQPIPLPAHLR